MMVYAENINLTLYLSHRIVVKFLFRTNSKCRKIFKFIPSPYWFSEIWSEALLNPNLSYNFEVLMVKVLQLEVIMSKIFYSLPISVSFTSTFAPASFPLMGRFNLFLFSCFNRRRALANHVLTRVKVNLNYSVMKKLNPIVWYLL